MMKTVLIVDDSASIRGLVSATLQAAGYNTVEACNGEDALTKVKRLGALHVVLTDLNMPIMDGIAFIQKFRMLAAHKYVPVLMLTTEMRNEEKVRGKAAGATGWLTKPFDPEQLIATVSRVLS